MPVIVHTARLRAVPTPEPELIIPVPMDARQSRARDLVMFHEDAIKVYDWICATLPGATVHRIGALFALAEGDLVNITPELMREMRDSGKD